MLDGCRGFADQLLREEDVSALSARSAMAMTAKADVEHLAAGAFVVYVPLD